MQDRVAEGMSVVIPAYNAEKTISDCLAAVSNQRWDRNIEILVIDDGSNDRTAEIASSSPGVTVMTVPNGGAAKALNIGIQRARYELVASVDSDAILQPDWTSKVIPWFEDSSVAAVGGYVRTANNGVIGRISGYHSEICRDGVRESTDNLGSTNTAYRRSHIVDVGMFTERMKIGYDADICRKLLASGYRLIFERSAQCSHFWRDGFAAYLHQQYGYAYYRLELARRFRKAHNDTVGPGSILQVPAAIAVILSSLLLGASVSPHFLFLLVLLPLMNAADAIRILHRYGDVKAALALPWLFTIRNTVWVYAALVWSVRWALDNGVRHDNGG